MASERARQLLVLLRSMERPNLVGAEVGVLKGQTSRDLLQGIPDLYLHMVDLWGPNKSPAYLETGDQASRLSKEVHEANYVEAKQLTKFAEFRRKFHRTTSAEAVNHLPPLDFVFIDGDHSKKGCYEDIVAYYNLVKEGGLVGGHDYYYKEQGKGRISVTEAVEQFRKEKGLPLNVGEHSVWWLWKPVSATT